MQDVLQILRYLYKLDCVLVWEKYKRVKEENSMDEKEVYGKEVRKLRDSMGMNRKKFCDYYGIPYRTVQDWEAGKRKMPAYVLRMMKYVAEKEQMIKIS